ncbi:MAG: 4-hydroxybenzoate octaprenyltransferase [Proteobacteria bacterium]|nr:4-hydroxybenzoate octaprenyltransferase [Pseudomonadota bacterium]
MTAPRDTPPDTSPNSSKDAQVKDAVRGNWVDRSAPPFAKPYLRLARIDRPIGTWLLLWPGWWSLALAASAGAGRTDGWALFGLPNPALLLLFGIGAIAMRGAGCTYNDIVDRKYDAQVERTRGRPLPSGAVSVVSAGAFLALLGLIGLAVLLSFNTFAIALGVASLVLIAGYPFMKRITWWPQVWLGLAFNYGALLGWAAATGGLSAAPVVLYLGGIAWTLGYDTIYAHQDKEDDALAGVKSSARWLGRRTRPFLYTVYALAAALIGLAGALAGVGSIFYAGLALALAHLMWQAWTVDTESAEDCLAKFRSNKWLGWIVFAAIVAGSVTA